MLRFKGAVLYFCGLAVVELFHCSLFVKIIPLSLTESQLDKTRLLVKVCWPCCSLCIYPKSILLIVNAAHDHCTYCYTSCTNHYTD